MSERDQSMKSRDAEARASRKNTSTLASNPQEESYDSEAALAPLQNF